MKKLLWAIALSGVLCFGTARVQGQVYDPNYGFNLDPEYQQYLNYQNYQQWQHYLDQLRQSDPYYELHRMHYQLHIGAYDPYRYYPTCCYVPSMSPFASRNLWAPYGTRPLLPYGPLQR